MPNKVSVINCIINALEKKLQQAVTAANQAHAAAVDDQSVAETQYDTLAIEASYLAEGQSKRVNEYHHAIEAFNTLKLGLTRGNNQYIKIGTLVQLSIENKPSDWFFISPAAGGLKIEAAQKWVTVITPHSPIGKALVGRKQGDDIEVLLGLKKIDAYILSVK
jgi:transcription elongation GreA/GreB family factor